MKTNRVGITLLALLLIALCLSALSSIFSTVNAKSIEIEKKITIEKVGAAQGICTRNGFVYIYGDVLLNGKHTGVIRELNANFQPTGKVVQLTKNGKTILRHPTGLTWHQKWGTFMGDTVNGIGVIYRLDWQKMWKDGNLDNAIKGKIIDDASINGTRPEFVTYKSHDYIATADYGDRTPEIRLYALEPMIKAKKTSAQGVIRHRAQCGPFNQNLFWHKKKNQLICIQNITAGIGWQLDILDINKLFKEGYEKARVKRLQFNTKSELEGFRPWKDAKGVFVTSSKFENLAISKPLADLE